MRLGLTLAVRVSPQQLIYRRSPAVSVVPIPHTPQLYTRRSGRSPGAGVTRVKCIDRPQFRQTGRLWPPTGRVNSCTINIVNLGDAFIKRASGIQTLV